MAWQWLVGVFSFILFIWGILPYFTGRIRNVGVWATCTAGIVGLLTAFCGKPIAMAVWSSGKAVRGIVCVLGAVLAALLLLFVIVSVLIIARANRKSDNKEVTVLIPGARLYEDRPSRMLLERIQAAALYLRAHPDLPCVVSGGQGADEPCAEASMMRTLLIEMGIDESRIYVEDKSTNTFENMQFSREIITAHHLPTAVVIATQAFHQYRCGVYAQKAELTPVGALPCKTPLHLLLCYWVREYAGICRMWLLGY